MIYTDSRYATGLIMYANDSRLHQNTLSVYRTFPDVSYRFFTYTWTSEDRPDIVANDLLGSPTLWWKIMDINPEVVNPFAIAPGTVLRIPSA